MICPKCGAESKQAGSKQLASGLITKRRRRCANRHAFYTYEVSETLFFRIRPAYLDNWVEATLRRVSRFKRNMQIWLAIHLRQELAKTLEDEFHLTAGRLRQIANQFEKEHQRNV